MSDLDKQPDEVVRNRHRDSVAADRDCDAVRVRVWGPHGGFKGWQLFDSYQARKLATQLLAAANAIDEVPF